MNKMSVMAAGAAGTGINTIIGWFLAKVNIYMTAIGWGMTPDVIDAFSGLIVVGVYDLIRQLMDRGLVPAQPAKPNGG